MREKERKREGEKERDGEKAGLPGVVTEDFNDRLHRHEVPSLPTSAESSGK